jgi:peroxiredoxin Q/BCP
MEETMAKELKMGDKAPAFNLPCDDGKTYRLADFKGKTVILYFYPKAMTPGCTQEACDFRDLSPHTGNTVTAALSPIAG